MFAFHTFLRGAVVRTAAGAALAIPLLGGCGHLDARCRDCRSSGVGDCLYNACHGTACDGTACDGTACHGTACDGTGCDESGWHGADCDISTPPPPTFEFAPPAPAPPARDGAAEGDGPPPAPALFIEGFGPRLPSAAR